MKLPWQFAGLKTRKGNVLKDFLASDKHLQARIDSFLRRMRVKEVWAMPDSRHLGDGVAELRHDYLKVEYRLYGYFGPQQGQFTVLVASGDKKSQQTCIKQAKAIKRQIDNLATSPDVENYDV